MVRSSRQKEIDRLRGNLCVNGDSCSHCNELEEKIRLIEKMIWILKRLPDEKMTPFKPGDLIVPRGTEYHEDPAIFLGLSWEHHPRENVNPTTGVKFVEDGWVVYPWVYTSGRKWGIQHFKGKVWGTDWHYIINCELIHRDGEPTKPSKYWEKSCFRFFVPPSDPVKQSIFKRFRSFWSRR